jgi:FMN reductase
MISPSKSDVRIAVVCGSVRPGNYTRKAVGLVMDELAQRPDVAAELIDPADLDLRPPGVKSGSDGAEKLQAAIDAAAGVILATPEYHGGFSSVTKLVIENLGFPSRLSGKPVGLLGVASGSIGAIKSLEQLRSVASHVGAIVLPGPVSVAGVRGKFDEDGNCLDEAVEKRIRGLADNLVDYVWRHTCPRVALEAMVREGAP